MTRHILCSMLFASLSLSLYATDKPDLSGAWRLDAARSDLHGAKISGLTWMIEQSGDTVHISEVRQRPDGKELKTDYDCTIDGKECQLGAKGQPTSVSFWYNGPALVEMVTKGHNRESIVKKRMKLSADGRHMDVELIPMVGAAAEKGNLVFEKK